MNTIQNNTAISNVQNLDAVVCATIVKNSQNYNGVSYASIPLHLLYIPSYQRQQHAAVANMANNWSDQKCGAITVSYRDEKFWVVDGQNRVAAAKIAGRQSIFAMILTGLTKEDEIEMFVDQNKNCKIVSAYDKLMAQADGEIQPGSVLVNLCHKAHVKMVNRGAAAPGVLACANTLQESYNKIGEPGVSWIFDTIKSLGWHSVRRGYSSVVIRALTRVYESGGDKASVKTRVLNVTAGMSPIEVVRKATTLRPTYGDTSALSLYWGA